MDRKLALSSPSSVGQSSSPPSYYSSHPSSSAYSAQTLEDSQSPRNPNSSPSVPVPPKASVNTEVTPAYDVESQPIRSFPQNLPPRKPAERRSFRSCWHVRWGAYSLRRLSEDPHFGSVRRTRWRRISMIILVFFRMCISAEALLIAWYCSIGAFVVYLLLSLISLWSTFACLATIGDASGVRMSMGMNIVGPVSNFMLHSTSTNTVLQGRKWLDIFIHTQAALHIVVTAIFLWLSWYCGKNRWVETLPTFKTHTDLSTCAISGAPLMVVWMVFWIAIVYVAWIAARPSDLPVGPV